MGAIFTKALAITGAGISAESGIPTFRGKEGYWRNRDPKQMATRAAFEREPAMIWEWYRERRALISARAPNAAHEAIVRLSGVCEEFLLITQNVDDLHQRAEWEGNRLEPQQIVQIHGDIFLTKCSQCSFRRRTPMQDLGGVPICPLCNGKLRPGVVWFGEELDSQNLQRVDDFLGKSHCELVLVIGTTALFGYIIHWALGARSSKGRLVEINPEETPLSDLTDEALRQPAAVALPSFIERLIQTKSEPE